MKVDWLGPPNFMKQSPSWAADNFSTNHEIPYIVLNLKDHQCVRNSPPAYPCPDPDQSSPHPTIHFLEICFNIILPSMPRCSKLSLSLRFFTKSCMHAQLLSRICAIYPYLCHFSWFTQIIFGEYYYHKHAKHIPLGSASRLTGTSCIRTHEYKSWSSLLCSFLQFCVTTSILGSSYLRQHPIRRSCDRPPRHRISLVSLCL